jgi:hypothetical protein
MKCVGSLNPERFNGENIILERSQTMIKNETLKNYLAKDAGMTEEDMEKATPEWEAEFVNMMTEAGYRMTAEVVRSKYCLAGMKPGMKFVLDDGFLNTELSTAPMCSGALAPLMDKAVTFFDRVTNKGDKPISLNVWGFRCLDPGFALGGFGTTEFKITVEKL